MSGRSSARRHGSARRCQARQHAEYVVDIRLYQGVIGDPRVAHNSIAIHNEDRPFTDAPEAFAVRQFSGVHDPKLADNFAIEVAEQWKRQVQLLGEGRVRAIALDAQAEKLCPQLSELRVVLTERTQLVASNAAKIEDVPQEDDRAARQAGV
jgi:hypothetical protein